MSRRIFLRIGMLFGALMLAGSWWMVLLALKNGYLSAYANYWNAPIGSITLLIGLIFLTPLWAWAVWRFWNWQGHTAAKD